MLNIRKFAYFVMFSSTVQVSSVSAKSACAELLALQSNNAAVVASTGVRLDPNPTVSVADMVNMGSQWIAKDLNKDRIKTGMYNDNVYLLSAAKKEGDKYIITFLPIDPGTGDAYGRTAPVQSRMHYTFSEPIVSLETTTQTRDTGNIIIVLDSGKRFLVPILDSYSRNNLLTQMSSLSTNKDVIHLEPIYRTSSKGIDWYEKGLVLIDPQTNRPGTSVLLEVSTTDRRDYRVTVKFGDRDRNFEHTFNDAIRSIEYAEDSVAVVPAGSLLLTLKNGAQYILSANGAVQVKTPSNLRLILKYLNLGKR